MSFRRETNQAWLDNLRGEVGCDSWEDFGNVGKAADKQSKKKKHSFQGQIQDFPDGECQIQTGRSSFPIIHKVDNIDISVQLLRKINWKQLRNESISVQIYIYHDALNSYWNDWFLYLTYFQK